MTGSLMPRTQAVADRVLVVQQVGSTNDLARQMVVDGRITSGMTVVSADVQTAGHGRLGRVWMAYPGESFTVTFVSFVPMSIASDDRFNGWLPMLAGLASLDSIGDVVRSTTEDMCAVLQLKWPNDLFYGGNKLGGILVELVQCPHRHDDAVAVLFGVGINLRVPQEHLPTAQSTSLQLHVDGLAAFDELRDALAARIVHGLRVGLRELIADPDVAVRVLHRQTTGRCWTLGHRVEVAIIGGERVNGTAVGLGADASLQVQEDSGVRRIIRTGDVAVLGGGIAIPK